MSRWMDGVDVDSNKYGHRWMDGEKQQFFEGERSGGERFILGFGGRQNLSHIACMSECRRDQRHWLRPHQDVHEASQHRGQTTAVLHVSAPPVHVCTCACVRTVK